MKLCFVFIGIILGGLFTFADQLPISSCSTIATFNQHFDYTGQKFVFTLAPGQSAATAFNSGQLPTIELSTSDTVNTPPDADHEISISKCPGDFSKTYPCSNQFIYVGGVVHASATNSAIYLCRLEPNTIYYMNVRQITKGSAGVPSCSLGNGCEVRVQIQGYN